MTRKTVLLDCDGVAPAVLAERARNRASYQRNKPQRLADVKAYKAAHPEKVREYYARNRAKHGDRMRAEKNAKRLAAYAADPRGMWLRETFMAAQTRSRKRGLPFDAVATIVGVVALPDTCPVLGIALAYHARRGVHGPDSPSLDRIVPERGYVAGNLRVISNRANTLKNNATAAELRLVLADMEKLP